MSRWAAVLAGGSGTRFWPLSTPDLPKQMLALAGGESLLLQAVRRKGTGAEEGPSEMGLERVASPAPISNAATTR